MDSLWMYVLRIKFRIMCGKVKKVGNWHYQRVYIFWRLAFDVSNDGAMIFF